MTIVNLVYDIFCTLKSPYKRHLKMTVSDVGYHVTWCSLLCCW